MVTGMQEPSITDSSFMPHDSRNLTRENGMAFSGLDAEGSRDHLPIGNPMQQLNEEINSMPAF